MYSNKLIEAVWKKGKEIQGKNPDTWRRDEQGNVIRRASFGTLGDFGWEIHHSNPVSNGGTDNLRNLRPLHWEENREKSDKR